MGYITPKAEVPEGRKKARPFTRAVACDIICVKTVRFSQVVAKSGKPEIHLTLTSPAKDRHLQSAIKAHKVMTVRQDNAGSKVDRGEIGFEEGSERQYLIFPRSLQRFAGSKVVGIKYDLIAEPEISASQLAPPPREKKRPKVRPTASQPLAKALAAALSGSDEDQHGELEGNSGQRGEREGRKTQHKRPRASKTPERPAKGRKKATHAAARETRTQSPGSDEIAALKKIVRKAMAELEKGKAVAAFNLLKQISDP